MAESSDRAYDGQSAVRPSMRRMTRNRTLTATTLVVLVAGLFAAAPAQAAPGDLDPTFSGDGKQLATFGVSDYANELALQPDGKVVVVGGATPALVGRTASRWLVSIPMDRSMPRSTGAVRR